MYIHISINILYSNNFQAPQKVYSAIIFKIYTMHDTKALDSPQSYKKSILPNFFDTFISLKNTKHCASLGTQVTYLINKSELVRRMLRCLKVGQWEESSEST